MIPEDITPEQAAALVPTGKQLLAAEAIGDLEKRADELLGGLPVSRRDRGPRRPRVHKPRLLGSRAYAEVPAKTKRQRKNRAQRQARKANR